MREFLLVIAVGGLSISLSACVSKMFHGDYIRALQQDEVNKLLWAEELRRMEGKHENMQ